MPVCPQCGTDNPERAKFCFECGRPFAVAAAEPVESRRVVTVLFSDIVGSTALGETLDPETLREVMTRYFAAMEAVLERHGGSVEKFIGDAIMAVFGLRVVHEDDALRAVRAAVEMRAALGGLNAALLAERSVTIATRTGVHTGQVVAGDPSARQALVTGDTVNTAARLEQAAGPGEILIGDTTWRLVRGAVDAEPVEPIGAKGKAEPVAAVRVISLIDVPPVPASDDEPLVGRALELEALWAVFERVVATRHAERVTVVGPAGVGKSRLVAEFLDGLAGRARVLRGRCLPYGDGVTYWPLREVLGSAAGIVDSDAPAAAARKLELLVSDLDGGALMAARLASAIALSAEPAPQDEVFWAVRRTLAHLASAEPLVLVVEDTHWAERTFLDLLDQVVTLGQGVSLLIVCAARPETTERADEPTVPGPHDTTITIDGLPVEAAEALLDSLPGASAIPPGLRERILASAEGNPLFVREMVAMLTEGGRLATGPGAGQAGPEDASIAVPPTIHALMAARVDGLPASERSLAQRASVVGRVFDQLAVVELTPAAARANVASSLVGLVRRELVLPEGPGLSVSDAYKFRHILLRDAAYEALRKRDRADLHERFADWLEAVAGERRMEFEEILGFHLGEAHRYRVELRETGPQTADIGARAARHLHAAARRARDRGDSVAAIRLYRRAEQLPGSGPDAVVTLRLDHALALYDVGQGAEGLRCADDALRLALEIGDRRSAARARLLRLDFWRTDGTATARDSAVLAELDAARADAEASADPAALAETWSSISERRWSEGDHDASLAALETALVYATAAGDVRRQLELELNALVHVFAGPTPADQVATQAASLVERAGAYPTVRAEAGDLLAVSEAMLGQFDDGRAHVEQSIATLADFAQLGSLVNTRTYLAWVHRLAGDLPAAEAVLREALAEALEIGDRGLESFVSCRLAEVLVNQGRFDDAEAPLAVAERDPIGATESRIVGARARIRAARGDAGATRDVERLLALVADGPWLNVRTEAYLDAAHALESLGARDDARRYAQAALEMCVAKADVALAERTRAFVARLVD